MEFFKILGKHLFSAWRRLAQKIGWVNEHLLLGIVFFVFIGFYAIPIKIFEFFKSKEKSTWRKFELNQKTIEDLEKQF